MEETLHQCRILLVDDVKENISLLVEALKGDYKLGFALDGPNAIKYARRHRPDLILLDIMMPGMDGFEVSRKLKADPQTKDIPFLFISAMDEVKNKTAGFEAGAVDYITKPFEIMEVKARVKTHLSLITARQQLAAQNARLRHSLSLAMEVQQNLIPKQDPQVEGFDIAGKILYCDETGGDYYDYLQMAESDPGKIGIVVGDVSEHGIPSALLMTTARAFIRHRSFQSDSISEIVGDVNRQFALDVGVSGRFMTLFLCQLNALEGKIDWVRAGHDPALLYDPDKEHFDFLGGKGVPLGVFPDSSYQQLQREIFPGQIIAICTDGIWEASNAAGELFGKNRLKAAIRQNADRSAKEILAAIMDSVGQFGSSANIEDDQTAVIVKVLDK